MFKFRNYEKCEFVVGKNMNGNLSVSVYSIDKNLFLYQLTEDIPYPINQGMVVFKEAPFVFQFLAQMQESGILLGGLQRLTSKDGEKFLMGRIANGEQRTQRASARA